MSILINGIDLPKDEKKPLKIEIWSNGDIYKDYGYGYEYKEGIAIPTIEERKEGHWITEYNGNGWNDFWDYTCSVCGKKYERADILYKANYCPNCGAKMKAE